jgi:hypothetical protein
MLKKVGGASHAGERTAGRELSQAESALDWQMAEDANSKKCYSAEGGAALEMISRSSQDGSSYENPGDGIERSRVPIQEARIPG